ncbi:MAG: hypothetical protein E7323_03460 [Clostridiales bacterium]|nr:hypothetical protein [Clostridiales bacterium]
MRRIIAVFLCISICISFCACAYAETETKVVTTELSVTLGESIDLKPFLASCFGSSAPSGYRFIDGENPNGVIQDGIFTPDTTDAVAVSPVFANGSDVCNGYRQIMAVYVVDRPGQNGSNGISISSGTSIHLLEVMPVEYRLASLSITFHIVDAGEAEPVLDGDLLTVTDKPVNTVAVIKAVMQDGIAPGQDSEYEMLVEVRGGSSSVEIFKQSDSAFGEIIFCDESIDIRRYVNDEFANAAATIDYSINQGNAANAVLTNGIITASNPGLVYITASIPDYYGSGHAATDGKAFVFCEHPAAYEACMEYVCFGKTFNLVRFLEGKNKAWMMGASTNTYQAEYEGFNISNVTVSVLDAGSADAEIVNNKMVVFANEGNAIIRVVLKNGAQNGEDSILDINVIVTTNGDMQENDYEYSTKPVIMLSNQVSQYLGLYVDKSGVNNGGWQDFDPLKWEFVLKDAGTTNARLENGVFYAPYAGTAIVTFTAKNAYGAGKDYVSDMTVIVTEYEGNVIAGSAVWNYRTGELLSGKPAGGVSYNASNHTLMLENAVLTANAYQQTALIQSAHDLTIELRGDNILVSNKVNCSSIDVSGTLPTQERATYDYVVGGGKLTFVGEGKLITDRHISTADGVINVISTNIECLTMNSGSLYLFDSVLETKNICCTCIYVEGDKSYVCSVSDDIDTGITFDAYDGRSMIVAGGTVIASGIWAYDTLLHDEGNSNGDMPQIHPSYTNARVWMGHTEEEANARGPLPQKVLQPYNFYEYIRIAPIEETEPAQTPEPSVAIPPQTGDTFWLPLYTALSLASALFLMAFYALHRRKTI